MIRPSRIAGVLVLLAIGPAYCVARYPTSGAVMTIVDDDVYDDRAPIMAANPKDLTNGIDFRTIDGTRLWWQDTGDRVRVLSNSWLRGLSKCEVLSGSNKGKIGWIAKDWLERTSETRQ